MFLTHLKDDVLVVTVPPGAGEVTIRIKGQSDRRTGIIVEAPPEVRFQRVPDTAPRGSGR